MYEWIISLPIPILASIIGAIATSIISIIIKLVTHFIKRKKLVFSKIQINPTKPDKNHICYAIFKLDIYNPSDKIRAIRNPKVVYCFNKQKSFEEEVQETKLYKNSAERDENEKYRSDIDLREIQPHGNLNQLCKIEFSDFEDKVTKAYLIYKNENLKEKRIKISWINKTDKTQGENK